MNNRKGKSRTGKRKGTLKGKGYSPIIPSILHDKDVQKKKDIWVSLEGDEDLEGDDH
jgi:hypothetical protein